MDSCVRVLRPICPPAPTGASYAARQLQRGWHRTLRQPSTGTDSASSPFSFGQLPEILEPAAPDASNTRHAKWMSSAFLIPTPLRTHIGFDIDPKADPGPQ